MQMPKNEDKLMRWLFAMRWGRLRRRLHRRSQSQYARIGARIGARIVRTPPADPNKPAKAEANAAAVKTEALVRRRA